MRGGLNRELYLIRFSAAGIAKALTQRARRFAKERDGICVLEKMLVLCTTVVAYRGEP